MTNSSVEEHSNIIFNTVEEAIADIAAGKAVVVVDSEDRENEGDLIFAAEKATPELVGFMVRYSSGYICAALTPQTCDKLLLPPMAAKNQDARSTAYAVTVDANTGSTGISARSRAETLRRLANPQSTPDDFTRPGHVVPLRAREGGVLVREGHTEASVDLARLAGLEPAGVLCEIVSEIDPTDMARTPELREFADEHGLSMISIDQLKEYREAQENLVVRGAQAHLPTEYGEFEAYGYTNEVDGIEHVALVKGDIGDGENVLVRLHSECLTGDVFGSLRCDCGQQLHSSLRDIADEGRGVLVYMRGHEGRGIGILAKLQAYHLQDEGADTVDANLQLGHPADARDFSAGAHILKDLGVKSVRLLSNNPLKVNELEKFGIAVNERVPVAVEVTENNVDYLRTKRDRMEHDLPWVAEFDAAATHK